MEPRDEAARKSSGVAIHGDIEAFVSPVDGSVISDRKQLAEHNKRNNVVNAGEFTPEFYERKQKERESHYRGDRTRQQVQRDREEIHEIITRHERNGNRR